jgi:hypothetical protein
MMYDVTKREIAARKDIRLVCSSLGIMKSIRKEYKTCSQPSYGDIKHLHMLRESLEELRLLLGKFSSPQDAKLSIQVFINT